jgi:hypothetical protein
VKRHRLTTLQPPVSSGTLAPSVGARHLPDTHPTHTRQAAAAVGHDSRTVGCFVTAQVLCINQLIRELPPFVECRVNLRRPTPRRAHDRKVPRGKTNDRPVIALDVLSTTLAAAGADQAALEAPVSRNHQLRDQTEKVIPRGEAVADEEQLQRGASSNTGHLIAKGLKTQWVVAARTYTSASFPSSSVPTSRSFFAAQNSRQRP